LNGAAARLVQPGDNVIIIAYSVMTEEEARNYKPRIAILDANNKVAYSLGMEEPATVPE
jgi:aspartate 1-decarboxylase